MGDGAADTKAIKRTFIVPAIKAFDHYDFTRAKVSCSLTWLVAKAFGSDSIPEELLDPFYRDQYSQEHLKPPLVALLQTAELYCRAGSLILRSDAVRPLLGHNAVIQALAQKGLYVTEQERLVTERDLANTPIHMSSHLALIDTLMMAYTVEMVSVERVVACVSRLGPAHSDLGPAHGNQDLDELPYDTEEAITTWINKVNGHLRDILVEEQKVRESSGPDATTAAHKSRFRREAGQRGAPLLPLVDSLLKDNTDGCALAALLHYYCPSTLPLEDVCLKETMSLADSLYNLQLVQDFCRDNLNHCCHFSLEDMLYTHASIKSNYLVFMAELFWWFEVVKPSFVQPRVFNPQACEPVGGVVPVCSPANHRQADTPGSPAKHRQAVSPGLPDDASLTPKITATGIIRRSASMSYVDGSVGTWPKERRTSSRAISFEIPLDGDPSGDPYVTLPPRGMRRSASSEGLGGFKVHHASRGAMRRHVSLTPVSVNGQAASRHIPEEEEDYGSTRDSNSQKPLGRQETFTRRNQSRYSNGVVTDNHRDSDASLRGNHGGGDGSRASPTTPPSIEEALKIIHATERPHATLGAGDHAFFLHRSSDPDPRPASGKGKGGAEELNSASTEEVDTEEVDTGIHVRTEDIQESQDEDSSSLRDYSDMDPDWDPPGGRSCPLPQTPDREGQRGRPGGPGGREEGTASPASSSGGSGGVRMTSFAEQKFRKLEGRSSGGTTPESSELNVPYTHSSRAPTPEARSPAHPAQTPPSSTPSPRDPSHMLASEMVHLKMKLEEKRRAIEAQKKKVEEAFTRHRQRMGRTAFLNVVRRKGVVPTPSSPSVSLPPASPTPLSPSPGPGDPGLGRAERCKPDGAAPKSPCEDGGGAAAGEVDLVEYTRSIERLNSSLGLLQTEMQRLAQQQDRIMAMRDHTHTPRDHTHTPRDHTHTPRDHTHTAKDHTQQAWVIPAPAPSPHRQLRDLRSCSVAGRGSVGSLSPLLSSSGSPLGPRRSPGGLKRRPASFHARTPRTPRPADLKVAPFSRMLNTPTSVDSLPRLRRFCPSQTQLSSRAYLGHDEGPLDPGDGGGDAQEQSEGAGGGPGEGREEEGAGASCLPAGMPSSEGEERREGRRPDVGVRQSREETQPASEGISSRPAPSEGGGAGRRGLVEVPLSVLKPLDGHGLETGEGGASGETDTDDQKMCCGFFFKDDLKGEEDMAVKRAALLERRERREKEALERRQQQELEQEQKKEAIRLKAEEEQQKKEEERSRRDFIKNEYMRRKQLKLMDDMDDVIKPRPGSLKKKTRPKSIHRDVMESPKPPVRATGVRPRGYSVSSVSLASLNLADHDGTLPDKRTPRPDSAEGFLSSCPSGSRNGEKDWEAESTTSSTPSNNTEYTGPKLYKEPSAKSNKHIIQNALAHCCLAGKVNEGQKNKILDEMEKSEANNFLILFRDAGCQFRSVYAYFPETENITKLAGIGPRSITAKMVDGLYKYNSDRKQFSAIPAKTMSASVDAITIASHLWQVKKQNTSKILQTK